MQMTNKYMYFIANWKMFGGLNTLNSLHKVVKFFRTFKKNKLLKIIYCPPSTLIRPMSKKLKIQILKLAHKIVMKVMCMVLSQVQLIP